MDLQSSLHTLRFSGGPGGGEGLLDVPPRAPSLSESPYDLERWSQTMTPGREMIRSVPTFLFSSLIFVLIISWVATFESYFMKNYSRQGSREHNDHKDDSVSSHLFYSIFLTLLTVVAGIIFYYISPAFDI